MFSARSTGGGGTGKAGKEKKLVILHSSYFALLHSSFFTSCCKTKALLTDLYPILSIFFCLCIYHEYDYLHENAVSGV